MTIAFNSELDAHDTRILAELQADARLSMAELGRRVQSGTIYVNRCDHADLYLPWGGVKDSGLGRTNGRVGLIETTAPKAFHVRRKIA